MIYTNAVSRSRSEILQDQITFRSLIPGLLIISLSAFLMMAVIYLVLFSVVIDPHSSSSPVSSSKILEPAVWQRNHADSNFDTATINALSIARVNVPGVDGANQITIQTSRHI